MKTDDLIKYALIAAGVYIVWQYVLVPMMAAPSTTSLANAAANPTTTQVIPSSAFPSTTLSTTMAPVGLQVNGGGSGSTVNLTGALPQ